MTRWDAACETRAPSTTDFVESSAHDSCRKKQGPKYYRDLGNRRIIVLESGRMAFSNRKLSSKVYLQSASIPVVVPWSGHAELRSRSADRRISRFEGSDRRPEPMSPSTYRATGRTRHLDPPLPRHPHERPWHTDCCS